MFGLFKTTPKAYKDVNAEQFQQLIKEYKGKAKLLDVRTPGEMTGGKIQGAIAADRMSNQFMDAVGGLPREIPVLVYCRSGARSAAACTELSRMGFREIYNLQGGIMSWPYGVKR